MELTLDFTPQVKLDVEAIGEDLRLHAEALDLCAACQTCLTRELEFPVLKAQSRSTQLMTTQTKGGDGGLQTQRVARTDIGGTYICTLLEADR